MSKENIYNTESPQQKLVFTVSLFWLDFAMQLFEQLHLQFSWLLVLVHFKEKLSRANIAVLYILPPLYIITRIKKLIIIRSSGKKGKFPLFISIPFLGSTTL